MKYEISITKTTEPKAKPADESKLGFGKIFTDHMFIMDYSEDLGWHDARIVPFGPLPIHPASTVLHYGAEIFEGMKAYRQANGDIAMFRPIENIRRLNNSAERLCLPQIDEEACMDILKTIVELEKDWVPHSEGTSLYLRPYLFGNDPHLGVHAVKNATFVVICSPVGAYYAEGIKPVKIAIESEDVRAVRGGTGYAKCGGNYAASLRAGKRAEEKGYTQVLWLDGVERKYIEEVGAMNVMFKIDGTIITPALTGSVLPGITESPAWNCSRAGATMSKNASSPLTSCSVLPTKADSKKLGVPVLRLSFLRSVTCPTRAMSTKYRTTKSAH